MVTLPGVRLHSVQDTVTKRVVRTYEKLLLFAYTYTIPAPFHYGCIRVIEAVV